jgi:WD40 repeat protein
VRITPSLKDSLGRLLDSHTLFGGRDAELKRLNAFLDQGVSGYLFVTALSGYGKSALLANWVRMLSRDNYRVCYHFMNRLYGKTSEEDFSLRNLCQQLAAYHDLRGGLPISISDLRALYPHLLSIPTHDGQKLVIVIDGLDEAQDWIGPELFPSFLPEGVFVVFSARKMAERDWLASLELPQSKVEVLELKTLGRAEISHLLRATGGGASKWADDNIFVTTIHKISDGDPFYLRYLVEDVRDERINSLAELENQPSKLKVYLDRWWQEVSQAVGETAVSDLLGYLLVARESLSRDDLTDISQADALSGAVFERTIKQLQRYVIGDEKNGYSLCHPRFRDYVAQERIKEREQEPYRQRLLDYCARWYEHNSEYALNHYANHLADAGHWDDLANLLLDLRFLEAKTRGPGTTVFNLLGDFDLALRGLLEEVHEMRRLVFLVSEILRLDAAFLAEFPEGVFQCLWNRGYWHDNASAKDFFAASAGSVPPWDRTDLKLSTLVERWRVEKEKASPNFTWLRALRPLPEFLGSAQRSIIRAESDSFHTVTVSPDGSRIIASMPEKGLIGVWDAHSAARLALMDLTEARSVWCVRFFGNGPRSGLAAAVTWDGRLIILDDMLQVADERQASQDHFGRVAVSPDGVLVATGDLKGVVALWAAERMALLRRWQAHANEITALEFSPCGKYLGSGEQSYSDENKVRIWEVDSENSQPLAEAQSGHSVESLCFSEDSTLVYWGDYEGAVERWTWGSGERSLVRDEHDSPASVVRLLGKDHLLCGVGGAFDPVPIEVWSLTEGRIEQRLSGHLFGIGEIALIPNSKRFVSAGDSTLRIWDLDKPSEAPLDVLEPEVSWVAFREPQGCVITASETSNTVRVRTLASGALVLTLDGHAEPVSGIALSHDGRLLACGVDDGSVHLWDLDSGQEQWQARRHKAPVRALAFFRGDGVLATGGEDGRVNLIATKNGSLIRRSEVHKDDSVHTIAVSNNGRLVASGGYSSLQVWDSQSRNVMLKLEAVTHYALWFAPGDEILVAEGISQFGMAWKIATGERLPDGEELQALYDAAMLRAGSRWRWSSPGNIGYAQQYLKLIDTRRGATVAAYPELQGELQWHPSGRIWVNKRSHQISLLQLEGPPET